MALEVSLLEGKTQDSLLRRFSKDDADGRYSTRGKEPSFFSI